MTNNYKQGLAVFIVLCGFSAIVGWLSGYDFDYRSAGVAVWTLCTALTAGSLGCAVAFAPRY